MLQKSGAAVIALLTLFVLLVPEALAENVRATEMGKYKGRFGMTKAHLRCPRGVG